MSFNVVNVSAVSNISQLSRKQGRRLSPLSNCLCHLQSAYIHNLIPSCPERVKKHRAPEHATLPPAPPSLPPSVPLAVSDPVLNARRNTHRLQGYGHRRYDVSKQQFLSVLMKISRVSVETVTHKWYFDLNWWPSLFQSALLLISYLQYPMYCFLIGLPLSADM